MYYRQCNISTCSRFLFNHKYDIMEVSAGSIPFSHRKCKRRNKRSRDRKKSKKNTSAETNRKNSFPLEVSSLRKLALMMQKLNPFILSELHIYFSESSFEKGQLEKLQTMNILSRKKDKDRRDF